MKFRSNPRPFCLTTWLATAAVVLLASAAIAPAHADNAQQVALSDTSKSDSAKPAAPAAEKTGQNDAAPGAPQPVDQAPPKSITEKAIDDQLGPWFQTPGKNRTCFPATHGNLLLRSQHFDR